MAEGCNMINEGVDRTLESQLLMPWNGESNDDQEHAMVFIHPTVVSLKLSLAWPLMMGEHTFSTE